ncbi:MAG: universal stress protein [Rhodothermales bacterium]|nr:universal stress protein [Rhodothermales bacterium]
MNSILIPVSLRDTSVALVEHAAPVAAAFGGTVWLLHIFRTASFLATNRVPPELKEQRDRELAEIHRGLDELAALLTVHGLKVNPYVLNGQDPADLILEQAEAVQADLVVMGSHGRGALLETLLGDVAHDVLRKARCPVLVIPYALLKTAEDAAEDGEKRG